MMTDHYRVPVFSYHSANDPVLGVVASTLSSCAFFCPAFLDERHPRNDEERNYTPPFLRRSSARAFLADSTSGARVLSGSAVLMNGCCSCQSLSKNRGLVQLTTKRSWALARLSGSTLSEKPKKSRNMGVRVCSSLIVGVPLVAISHSARSGLSFKYGGSPSIISMAIIPRDQISTLRPYSFLVTTSGAIQYGVPTMVVRLLWFSLICAQKPKSAVYCIRAAPMDTQEALTQLDVAL